MDDGCGRYVLFSFWRALLSRPLLRWLCVSYGGCAALHVMINAWQAGSAGFVAMGGVSGTGVGALGAPAADDCLW